MKIVNKLKIFNLLVSLIFWLIFDSLEQCQIKNAALRNVFGKQLCQKIYILNAKYILNVFLYLMLHIIGSPTIYQNQNQCMLVKRSLGKKTLLSMLSSYFGPFNSRD